VSEYLLLSDIHASRHPPSSCTATYWPDLVDLLQQTVTVAREREVRAVVWAGDVLHHKAPSRTDHGVVQDLIRIIKAYPCPVFIVPGNHDIQHDRLDSIVATQPLGVLYLAGAVRLEGWSGDNHPLYGVPWQQEWSEKSVQVATADFRERVFSQTLVVVHAPIYPPDREPRYEGAELTPASWWAGALEDGSLAHGLFYGHIHEPHGVYQAGTPLTFCNNGALSRGSLDEYNLEREVGCTLWDSSSAMFTFVPLKARPASEVFRLAEHQETVAAQGRLASLLDDIGQVRLQSLNVEEVIAHIKTRKLGKGVEDLSEELLTAAVHMAGVRR
jgi:DNA repair exonuclease SbcCD nuclease subunit